MFKRKYILCEEAGEGGAAGGASTGNNTQLEELQAELERLRSHSKKLLDEKKTLKATLDKFGDIDPEKFKGMMTQLESSEEARLLAEGKIDDVVARRSERKILEVQSQLEELVKASDTAKEEASTWRNKYNSAVVERHIRIAAEKAGVIPSAIDDVLARAKGVFSVTENDQLEARDTDGTLVKVGNKALDPLLFVESLKEKAPHYWPASQSGGAMGGAGGNSRTANPFIKGSKEYNVTEQAKLRRNDPQLAAKLELEARNTGRS
jgi:ElaB/YqjD/DUF883 family membrane-anchored ribosome-binding protein